MPLFDPVIAIIDGDRQLRRQLERILLARDYLAIGFDSAEDYLAHRGAMAPDAVIVDLDAPGIAATGLLSHVARDGAAIACVVTGQAADRQALADAATEFLVKPFDAVSLLAALDRALARRPRAEPRLAPADCTATCN